MLRVHRLAAAIDMIAAGTSAPITIAANATPANHGGNSFSNSCGTACCGFGRTFTPAAIATKPSSASSPSRKEYAGSSAALRRITERLRVESTPVTECGYMNSASAEPERQRGVGPVQRRPAASSPWAPPRPAAIASALSVLNVVKRVAGRVEDVAPAAELAGQVDHRDDDDDVDQRVLDERDQRRRPQPAGVGVGREHRERDEQRQVLDEPVAAAVPMPITSSTTWMPTSCSAM